MPMAKIPEVMIASFWNLSNDELPEHALLGEIIIVGETKDMYVGTGESTPILKITDLQSVETVDELDEKDKNLSILYLISSTNELYFFHNQILNKCNGLGVVGVYDEFNDLPNSNQIEGIFCVKADETNSGFATLYYYNTIDGYSKIHYADFDINSFYRLKVNNTYLTANNTNSVLKINTDNTLYSAVSNGKILINQKMRSSSTLSREQYALTSGFLEDFPKNTLASAYTVIAQNELYVMGYSVGSGTAFINEIYKYNNGWSLLSTGAIPFSNRTRQAVFSYNNKIYILGGAYSYNTTAYDEFYEYDPITGTFTQKNSMNAARCDFCYGIIDNKLWVLGGRTFNSSASSIYIRSVEYYDFETDIWTLLPSTYNIPTNIYAGFSFVINGEKEIHLINSGSKAIHYTFNVDTLIYTEKNRAAFSTSWGGVANTIYGTVYCIVNGGIYLYNNKDDTWTNCGSLLYNKYNSYVCIDDNGIIYNLGHYASNNNAKKLEIIQVFHKDITNDCRISIRQPLSKGLLYHNDSYRNISIPKGEYVEYLCCGGNETLDMVIEAFKY